MKVIIRADATPQMGTGHVMRCLALAQAARAENIPVVIVGRINVPWVLRRLSSEGISFINLEGDVPAAEVPATLLEQIKLAESEGSLEKRWIVLDGYHFGLDCQKAVRDAGHKLLVIDDYAHLPEYSCDILLNQNISSNSLVYNGAIIYKLLGSRYALLREEFFKARTRKSLNLNQHVPSNLLINFGGGDFSNCLAAIAQKLKGLELDGRTLRIICGSMRPEKIKKIFEDFPVRLEVLENVRDMPGLLLDTDLCITAGGSICWELCCLGVQFLTICIAENQARLVHALSDNHLASEFTMDTFSSLLKGIDGKFSLKLMSVVDGRGAIRVLDTMSANGFYLHDAVAADRKFVWELACCPEVRSVSGMTGSISWEEHCEWFAKKMNTGTPFFIASTPEGCPFAYVRFDFSMGEYIISIAISKEFRGRGIGSEVLKQAYIKFCKRCPGNTAVAKVMTKNYASRKIFEKNGFVFLKKEEDGGREFTIYQKVCE